MKGRAQPPPPPADDWRDGGWTVDCSCGVTFDDGEEMVSCDECGIWVHTRCAGFVRGRPSFACHNCRCLHPPPASAAAHDIEETEVARLLAELPTKAGAGADPSPFPPQPPFAGTKSPFSARRHVPMIDRVHVQGVPGGDPALFKDPSSIFTPQLWKCTGYIPKKFNFSYKEFPCWEDKHTSPKDDRAIANKKATELTDEDSENPACQGADVLFSLSKESIPLAPLPPTRWSLTLLDEVKQRDGRKITHGRQPEAAGKMEGSKLRAFRFPPSKKRKYHQRHGTDPGKKAAESNEGDLIRERSLMKDLESEDMSSKDGVPSQVEAADNVKKPKNILVVKTSRGRSGDKTSRRGGLTEAHLNIAPTNDQPQEKTESISGVDVFPSLQKQSRDGIETAIQQQDIGNIVDHFKQPKDESYCRRALNKSICHSLVDSEKLYIVGDDPRSGYADTSVLADSDDSLLNSEQHKVEGRGDQSAKISTPVSHGKYHTDIRVQTIQSSPGKRQHEGILNATSDEDKCAHTNREPEVISHNGTFKSHELVAGESAGLLTEISSNHVDRSMNCTVLKNGDQISCEKIPGTGASLTSSATAISRSVSDNSDISTTKSSPSSKVIHFIKKKRLNKDLGGTEGREGIAKPSSGYLEDSRREASGEEEHIHGKNSVHSGMRSSQASSQRGTSIQSQFGSVNPVQIKLKSSSSAYTHQPPSKVHHSLSTNPSSVSANAALSDEALALLLHQQLNSSPRVPRVTRALQASGIQLTSPTGASSLKRSCNFGGKDQDSVPKRKIKGDGSRDISKNTIEITDEPNRIGNVNLLHDHKHEVTAFITDGSIKNDTHRIDSQNFQPVDGSHIYSPDGTGALTSCTLPELIGEIVNRNREITLKELYDAIHPHWQNLRKPNGESYAYSGYSRAVLDCLRNRTEWCHLLGCGSMTSPRKRKRKHDPAAPLADSENETKDRALKGWSDLEGESHLDDVPKGRRKARKRRDLKGRAVGARARGMQHGLSDDDHVACSHSSNDGGAHFSEDGSHGVAGVHAAGGVAAAYTSSSGDDAD